jgi:hypothetical protein
MDLEQLRRRVAEAQVEDAGGPHSVETEAGLLANLAPDRRRRHFSDRDLAARAVKPSGPEPTFRPALKQHLAARVNEADGSLDEGTSGERCTKLRATTAGIKIAAGRRTSTRCSARRCSTPLSAFFPEQRAQLDAMVTEAGLSRMYGGIHYRFDIDAGRQLGQSVARFTMRADRSGHSVLTPDDEEEGDGPR